MYESDACARKGELAFSPVRAGVYVNQLKRFYEYVPPQERAGGDRGPGVFVRDGDARGGADRVAHAPPLPLVDPVSVTSDLMLATAGDSAHGRGFVGAGKHPVWSIRGRRIEDGDEAGLSLPRPDVVHQSALRTYPHWRGGGGGGVGDSDRENLRRSSNSLVSVSEPRRFDAR